MSQSIRLRNVRVHNLQSVSLDLEKKCLHAFCGVSGSGKSSLAMDTLFAEGQRRYLDTFSIANRGLIDQPEKPDADELEAIPPAISISRSQEFLSSRLTVANLTDLEFLFQIAFSRFGKPFCHQCGGNIEKSDADSVAELILRLAKGKASQPQVMIGFQSKSENEALRNLLAGGFQRVIHQQKTVRLDALLQQEWSDFEQYLLVLVDRVRVNSDSIDRLRESVETAMQAGEGGCHVLVSGIDEVAGFSRIEIDDQAWQIRGFSSEWRCIGCGKKHTWLSPNELSCNSSRGACADCHGVGSVSRFSADRMKLDSKRSVADGWWEILQEKSLNSFREKLKKTLGAEFEKPVALLPSPESGNPQEFILGVMDEFYREESRKTIRKKLSPFLVVERCQSCKGMRLNPVVLGYQLAGKNLGQISQYTIDRLDQWCSDEPLWSKTGIDSHLRDEILARLRFLRQVGLGYIELGREIQSLSTGERQRVLMTNALGSCLVNMLYIFDEPCAGLHPSDLPSLISSLHGIVKQGNTVVVVEHELELIRQVDSVTEFGPGSGALGGQLTFSGPPDELKKKKGSPTGEFLSGRRSFTNHCRPKAKCAGEICLRNARGNNLKGIDVVFPLGRLCVVTGVSGSGKSSLVVDTLYPAVQNHLTDREIQALPYDSVSGVELIDEVVMIDQSPLGGSSRSNPATYCKAFDAIRQVFADTVDARSRNFKSGKFSFNTEGGRCDACQGEGVQAIDMKFMANLIVKCKFCNGLRYKQEVLNCRYRNRSIADVLQMTIREAFVFFRGQKKVQSGLKPLIDVGLDYLQLGQRASSLSSGEAQRLRLAGFLAASRKPRTLFILDEPTIGLHFNDVEKLLDCFAALLSEGHSVVLVEHNKMVMYAADYLIDLGPCAAAEGGELVVSGTPEEVAKCNQSKTGGVLREIGGREQ